MVSFFSEKQKEKQMEISFNMLENIDKQSDFLINFVTS